MTGGGTGMVIDDDLAGTSTVTVPRPVRTVMKNARVATRAKSAEQKNMTTQRGKRFQPITERPAHRGTVAY